MKKMTYEKAVAELQAIVTDLQAEAISIDQLSDKARRAAELISFCKDKLRDTEKVIDTLFEKE